MLFQTVLSNSMWAENQEFAMPTSYHVTCIQTRMFGNSYFICCHAAKNKIHIAIQSAAVISEGCDVGKYIPLDLQPFVQTLLSFPKIEDVPNYLLAAQNRKAMVPCHYLEFYLL